MPGGRPARVLLFVAVLATCGGGTATADWADHCPGPCQCKWSSGKKTALCRDAKFTDVPTALDADTQVLDLSGNRVPRLPANAFKRAGLLNLQRVFLRGCGVRDVHWDAFGQLRILVELDLSDNQIGVLHPETFRGNDRLRVLYLNGNPLTEIGEAQFPVLQHLRTLELQHCQIGRVHRDAFRHLAALESLNLNGNRLKRLSEVVFRPVTKLKTLSLDGNPWVCDCRLRTFRDWFVRSNLYAHPLSCTEPPALAGDRWDGVDPAEFACAPDVRIERTGGAAGNATTTTFTCRATGDPEPEISWYFNGRAVDNYTDRMDENRTQPGGGDDRRDPRRQQQQEQQQLRLVWSVLRVYNASDAVAGEFTCEARNLRGVVSANVSLAVPEAAVATTLGASKSAYVAMVACGAAGAVALLLLVAGLACCACRAAKRTAVGRGGDGRPDGRKSGDGGGGFKGSSSFSDADKRLLDASVSTTTQAGSCEMLAADGSPSYQHLELVERRQQSLCDIPLAAVCSGDNADGSSNNNVQQQQPPVHITIESHDATGSSSLYPPPPEFSTTVLPSLGPAAAAAAAAGYGNIFISVSVTQEPHPPPPPPPLPSLSVQHVVQQHDSERTYPDLLDMNHRQKHQTVGTFNRHPPPPPLSSSSSSSSAAASQSPYYYATMPRKTRFDDNHCRHRQRQVQSSVLPHYDNMGPRITAAGSCANLAAPPPVDDVIPPPPPPPVCAGRVDYVAL